MKNIVVIITVLVFSLTNSMAQSLNWNTEEQNVNGQVYFSLGYNFGLTTQLGFAYKCMSQKPILLFSDISVPQGNEFNDFKFRAGMQMAVWNRNNVRTFVQYVGAINKYESNLVRQLGLSHNLALSMGIYKSRWSVAFNVGYEHTFLNKLGHSDVLRHVYPGITDAWFFNTAGYWHYGLEASKKVGQKVELYMRMGATNARGIDVDAIVPAYLQIGGACILN